MSKPSHKDADRVGILTDTHDNLWALAAIVKKFAEADVGLVIHCGDYVAPFTAKAFAELDAGFVGVFGNNDGERIGLKKAFSGYGDIHVGPYPVRVGGRRLLVMHEPAALDAIAMSGEFDAVLYGHTHKPELREVPHADGGGTSLILNVGEGSGWVTGTAQGAVLHVGEMRVEQFEVPVHP